MYNCIIRKLGYISCPCKCKCQLKNVVLLYSKNLADITFEKVENLYKEFEPKTRHIKYAVAIFSTDVDEDLVFVKEKYKLFSLRDIHHTFWSLYNKVQLLREE